MKLSFQSALAALNTEQNTAPLNPIAGTDPNTATKVVDDEATKGKFIGDRSVPEPEKQAGTEIHEGAKNPDTAKTDVSDLKDAVAPKTEEEKKEEAKASERFLAIARRERKIQQQLQALKAKEAELAAKESKVQSIESLKQEALRNPDKALELLGLSYDELTKYRLNGGSIPPEIEIKGVRNELEEYKKAQAAKEEARIAASKARKEQESQATIQEFKQDLSDFIDSNADNYKAIKHFGASQVVYDTIEEHFKKTQRILSIKDASDLVEKRIRDQIDTSPLIQEYKSKWGAQKPSDTPSQSSASQTRTLNNNMTSTAPSFLPAKTEAERMARAAAKLA